MNKDGEFSLVAKYGCHCAYANENSDNGNQKATSEYGVSFKQKSPTNIHFIVQFNSCFTSLFKCLNCNEFCTNKGRGNTQKELWQVKTSLDVVRF